MRRDKDLASTKLKIYYKWGAVVPQIGLKLNGEANNSLFASKALVRSVCEA